MKRLSLLLLLAFASMAAAGQEFRPFVGLGGNLFPSYLISTATVKAEDSGLEPGPRYFGDLNGMLGVVVEDARAGDTLRVKIGETPYNHACAFEAVVREAGEQTILPTIPWKFAALRKLEQPTPASFAFSVNGKKKYKNVPLRALNDCPAYFVHDNGLTGTDLSYMFAAYVNEDSPLVNEVLQAALNTGAVNSFSGYQGGEQEIINQLFALWYTLQLRHVRYSSITSNSGADERIFSQRVRFMNEVAEFQQANCVDGTVFFASLLRAVGIHPVLVLVPGHMYLGYYTSPERTEINVLETTMIGSVDVTDYDSPIHAASNCFNQALDVARQQFSENEGLFGENPHYKLIDVDEVRRYIKPLGR